MRRYILSMPADLALVDEAGNPLIPGTVVCPMPGTVAVDGRILADVEAETIDLPEGVSVLACQADSGDFVMLLDADEFARYLAPIIEVDEAGEIIGTTPAALHQPHQMGGWPDITQPAPDPAPGPRIIRDWQFRNRFTADQLVGIMRAGISGDDVAMQVWLQISTASDGVPLDDPGTVQGVKYVAAALPDLAIDPAVVLA